MINNSFQTRLELYKKISMIFIIITFCIKFLQVGYYILNYSQINNFLIVSIIFFNLLSIISLTLVLYGDISLNFMHSLYVMFVSFVELLVCSVIYVTYLNTLMIVVEIFTSLACIMMMSFVYHNLNKYYNQISPLAQSQPQIEPERVSVETQINNVSLLRQKYEIINHLCASANKDNISSHCEGCPCSICQDTCNKQLVYNLRCRHLFHQDCLEDWIRTNINLTCPICRQNLIEI